MLHFYGIKKLLNVVNNRTVLHVLQDELRLCSFLHVAR